MHRIKVQGTVLKIAGALSHWAGVSRKDSLAEVASGLGLEG